ncbi:lysophospholipid acyltransferase family protein [Porticoccaceae bacterium]|mgnify:FL=1|nr:lysophospholipid acyltransferase family protein [Porticoccaceae bacterium]MDB9949583.1 lysophospholipid acyltransferase family protein [Porticoccaceae bacterium]MDC1512763.1 lysophospholipid acyltransferase family protein [Porticoccaceae bacterium]
MRYTLFSTPLLSPALRVLSKIILKIIRWRVDGSLPTDQKKYVLIVAPHTSNWDFFLFVLTVSVLGLQPSVLIKDTIFIGPLGWFLRYCGAIPVNRRQAGSLVTYISGIYAEREEFVLIITPEGTRSPNANWKRGFHHVARAAEVPILVVYVDSAVRTIGIEGLMEPSEDVDGDIQKLKTFFDGKKGLKPGNYAS